jgi:CheY-like chemotaxis protein
MFDRQTPSETPSTDARAAVERLCALYDRLLEQVEARDPAGRLSEAASSELRAMARIYDLDSGGTDAEVWRHLRAVLLAQAPGLRAGTTVRQGLEAAPLTLLLVEDDADTAADLTAALSDAGHWVIGPFHHAEAAEAAVALQSVDLALLDINLSGETSGIALAQTLKSKWGVRSLFLSGDVGAAARHADLAEALVLKPYTGRQVLDAIAIATRP